MNYDNYADSAFVNSESVKSRLNELRNQYNHVLHDMELPLVVKYDAMRKLSSQMDGLELKLITSK